MPPEEIKQKLAPAYVISQPGSRKKPWAYFFCGLFLLIAAVLWVQKAGAATPSYDPWADSVTSSSPGVLNADNAVGAPNNTMAQMVGTNAVLTLDMGAGEEGTQTLSIHFGQINALININVDFLDSNQNVIASRTSPPLLNPNPSIQNFDYNWTDFGKAYRFVRVSSSQVGATVNVDAVEALGYIGSTPTQDTDGDGVPDRTEQQNGTDPLVPNGPGSQPAPPGSDKRGGTSSSSAKVNPPPAASNDKDGDGMPDDWERAHGLNPNDKTDATQDPDKDGLTNLTEYQIGSDPQKADTDGDGMPDGWEYKNGLDVLKNDADGDPDGDYLTNLGEYKHNTDPHKADDLYKVFGKDCKIAPASKKMSSSDWLIFALLILGALVSWLAAISAGPLDPPPPGSSRWYRFRYGLHRRLFPS